MDDDTPRLPPVALRKLDRWVNWEEDTKRPRPAISGQLLAWAEAHARDPRHVGFCFTGTPYAGIDIDADTEPELARRFLRWARQIGAYVERSPSGKGWHISGRGALRRGISKRAIPEWRIEAYSEGRYFTWSSQHTSGSVEVSIQPLLDELEAKREELHPDLPHEGEPLLWSEHYQRALDAIPCEQLDYGDWVRVGMALHNSGAPFAVWDAWSEKDAARYDPSEMVAKWNSFAKVHGMTLATVLWMAREHGWRDVDPEVDFPEWTEADEQQQKVGLVVRLADWHYPPPEWLVQGVCGKRELVHIFGEAGSGKSWCAQSILSALSRGDDEWLGHQVHEAGGVAYLVGEGYSGLRERFETLRADQTRVVLTPQGVPLEDGAPAKLSEAILATLGGPPVCLAVDTQSTHLDGNDNSAEDTEVFFRRLRALQHALGGCTVLVVHHAGHMNPERGRGSSNIRAAYDMEWLVQASPRGVVMTCTKWRGGDKRALLPITFNVAGEGVEELTPDAAREAERERGLSTRAAQALEVLRAAWLADEGPISMRDVNRRMEGKAPGEDPSSHNTAWGRELQMRGLIEVVEGQGVRLIPLENAAGEDFVDDTELDIDDLAS